MTLAEWRDIVVIAYGVAGILLMIALIFVNLFLAFAVRALSRSVRDLLNDPVRPTLEEIRRTVENVRGTSEFIADTAVSPLIRAVAVTRGIRRGVAAATGLRNRGRKR